MPKAQKADGLNLAYIGYWFSQKLRDPLQWGYICALFDYSYKRAPRCYNWAKRPQFSEAPAGRNRE